MTNVYKLPLGALCILALVAINLTHMLIHNTPLDGGALDVFVAQANVFLAAHANVD